MDKILELASGLTPLLQVVLIIVLAVIFWEPIAERIGWKQKSEVGTQSFRDALKPLLAQMELLSQYANHDTTRMHERTHELIEKQTQAINENTQIIKELKEYGVKCRDK